MFNIDFEDRRVKSALRTLQYTVLTILVLLGTVILVLAGQGYDFNTDTGQVIKNGLILVNSVPEGSQVIINDHAESDATPASFPVPDGDYRIQIVSDGYRQWNKNVQVTGAEVEWLYYPLLVPNQLDSQNLTVFLKLEFAGLSPSGRNLLVRQTTSRPTLNLLTFSPDGVSNEETLLLPADLLGLSGSKPGKFGFAGWAADNRHALVTHKLGGKTEYLWLDVEQLDQSRNLSQDFGLRLTDARFIAGDSQQLYGLAEGDLRRINLDDSTISAPLVRDVGRYVLYEDQFVVFIRNQAGGGQLGLIEGDDSPVILRDLPRPAANYRLEFTKFDDAFYLAMLDLKAGRMSLLTNPQSADSAAGQLPQVFNLQGAKYLSFSRNGQFVTIQAGPQFLTYDLDRKRRSNFDTDLKLADQPAKAIWMDGYRLLLNDRASRLHLFEFDGGNSTELEASNTDFSPFFDTGQNVLYSFTPPAEGRVFLRATPFTASSSN